MFSDDAIAVVTDGFLFSTGAFPERIVSDGFVGSIQGIPATQSRGDGVPIWIGVPSPPLIPTLAMVGKTQTPIRMPVHERESVRVALGTLHVRVVRASIMRRERLLVMIERGQQTGAERYAHREHHTISDSMLEAMSKTVAHYVEQRTMEIEGLQEASEAARTSGRKRFVRYDHEAGRVFLALEVQSQTSLATHCAERVTIPWATYSTESANRHMVMRESFSIQTAYKITYQRGISAREVAVIAAALGAFDEAA